MYDSRRTDAENWRKRAQEVARGGERVAVAYLCPDCYGVVPLSDQDPAARWPGVKYCECGPTVTTAEVLAIVGVDTENLGVAQPKVGPTDGAS